MRFLLQLLAAVVMAQLLLSPGSTAATEKIFDVSTFGATGNGITDDTAAFQRAFDALAQIGGSGRVRVPTGTFRITDTVRVDSPGLLSLGGDGPGSVLLWEVDKTLLLFGAKNPVGMITVEDITVASVGAPKSASSAALAFPAGLVKSQIENVQLIGAGGLPSGNVTATVPVGSGFDLGNVTDTVALRNCLLWFGSGTGVKIGRGSEVRIIGGRYIGTKNNGGPKDSIGIHVTGNNGGVHVTTSDVISWGTGMQLDQSNGQGSNREIFLSHATLDSNQRGLAVFDSSYVSIAGVWAASSDLDNIWTHPDSDPQLAIAGGTIFNAGALGGDCAHGQCNGITINAGTFVLNGVEVRNNKGNGIWTPSNRTTGYTISGCRIVNNGAGARLSGKNFVVTGNVFEGNADGNLQLYQPAEAHVVANNIGT